MAENPPKALQLDTPDKIRRDPFETSGVGVGRTISLVEKKGYGNFA